MNSSEYVGASGSPTKNCKYIEPDGLSIAIERRVMVRPLAQVSTTLGLDPASMFLRRRARVEGPQSPPPRLMMEHRRRTQTRRSAVPSLPCRLSIHSPSSRRVVPPRPSHWDRPKVVSAATSATVIRRPAPAQMPIVTQSCALPRCCARPTVQIRTTRSPTATMTRNGRMNSAANTPEAYGLLAIRSHAGAEVPSAARFQRNDSLWCVVNARLRVRAGERACLCGSAYSWTPARPR